MTTRVVLDHAAIDRLFRSPTGPAGVTLAKSAVKVEAAAIRLCPVDTGRLGLGVDHMVGDLLAVTDRVST
jgi:hypothetical protein